MEGTALAACVASYPERLVVPGPWCIQRQPDKDIPPQMVQLVSNFCHAPSKDAWRSVPQPGGRRTLQTREAVVRRPLCWVRGWQPSTWSLVSLWVGGHQRGAAWQVGAKRVSQLLQGKAAFPPPTESSAHRQSPWQGTG